MVKKNLRPNSGPLRIAWLGRVSTDDQQDPTLSLPRQLHKCRDAVPDDAVITCHFYDIESGRKDLEARGSSTAHLQFQIPIPRDGGINDLLKESRERDRRFDAVICESIERVARRTYYGTKIEHDLERCGVALFASDEPIVLGGKRATTILTRRVKQSVAEWYVLEILEKSWDGLGEHSRQGWNVGVPPYGYAANKIPHPVPARRAEGRTKTRLVPDSLRGPIVNQIFIWRVIDRLGYEAIASRLNADPERYPPPESPDPARRRKCWGRSSVYEILRNPKYTGFMVWNRRATKQGGKLNPPEDWIWSPGLTHEPIVTLETWRAANELGNVRQGSRDGSGPNVKHPQTRRTYILRSYVSCELCGNRMIGKTARRHSYYTCEPHKNLGPKVKQMFPDHPPSIYVREDELLAGISEFISDRVFGSSRQAKLEKDFGDLDRRDTDSERAKKEALLKALDELGRRQARQVLALERDDDPEGLVFDRVRERLRELERERRNLEEKLEQLNAEAPDEASDPSLLEEMPFARVKLADAPGEVLRPLFDALNLAVRYDRRTNIAGVEVVLDEKTIDRIESSSAVAFSAPREKQNSTAKNVAVVFSAPNGIRTRVSTLKGWRPRPLVDGGRVTSIA